MTTTADVTVNIFKAAFAPFTDTLKDAQVAALPDAARDFVKLTASSVQDRFADAHVGSEKVTAAFESAATRALAEGTKISRNVQQAFFDDAMAFFAGVSKLATAQTLTDAVKIQSDFLRASAETLLGRTKSTAAYLVEIGTEATDDAERNLREGVAAANAAARGA